MLGLVTLVRQVNSG